jgi:FkbM family methyltransferase
VSVIDEILHRPELVERPPVLIDVGASGGIHRDWAKLAPHSIGIAFEPDARERAVVEKSGAGWRRLIVVPAIVTDREDDRAEFFLARSPYCSSTLRPRSEALAPWAFHELFEVTETVHLPAVNLPHVLAEHALDRVDWFKTDSQGTDVRLFRSLGEARLRRVLAAQFEPGILEAYESEDTLAELLAFMPAHGFWLSELRLRGSQRLSARARRELPESLRGAVARVVKTAPGWGEATWLNTLDGEWSVRDRLLAWVIATLRRHHGFALELALAGRETQADPMFDRLRAASVAAIGRAAWTAPAAAVLRRLRALEERLEWA